jgi:enoyl-CoA hydratase/carnithine racemase
MPELEREGDVFVLRRDEGENRFHEGGIAAWNAALDEVEKADGPKALVTTGTGKFFSNGLDLDWALANRKDDFDAYLSEVLDILRRVLVMPCITVAAVNGHAFGAGAQLAMAHDFRTMRADRGYFCMPEIDMKAPLHPGMIAILKQRMPKQTVHEVIVTGRRFGGADAAEAGIVQQALPQDEVLPRAIEIAAGLAAKADPVMTRLKTDLYPGVVEALGATMGELG